MKAACSTAGFTRLPLEDALKNIRELDFDFVDLLMMENWAHINPSELVADPASRAKQVAEMLKANSLTAVAMNCNLSSPMNVSDPARQKSNLAEMEALAVFAENLGVPVIVLQPGHVNADLGPEKSQAASIAALRDVVKIADGTQRDNSYWLSGFDTSVC
jgi:sugar phosphate isomerase/epimerase